MDPVSVFNALYDTKILKFGHYDLKSGLVAPYYMNLRRLPLYPKLMDAIVTQVVEKFLTDQSLVATTSQLRQSTNASRYRSGTVKLQESTDKSEKSTLVDNDDGKQMSNLNESDADSQLEEDEIDISSEDSEWEKVTDKIDPILCGVPYGAVPLAAAIAYKSQLPLLFERKEMKAHGDQQCLMEDFNFETRSVMEDGQRSNEGQQRVILIEDVICSGESILDAVTSLEKRNLKVEFVICIVDREENGIKLLLEKEGIRVLPLYNMSAILRVLETTGRITNEQFIKTRQWMTRNQFEAIGVDPTSKVTTAECKLPLAV